MAGYKQRGNDPAHEAAGSYAAKADAVVAEHPLDSEDNKNLAKQLEQWWIEARDKHAQNRVDRFLDHDYYDHDQISPEDRAVYEERGQAPVVQNLIHGAVDWLSGTERRTRVDWDIQPRGPEDEVGAKAQKHLLKYVSDANRAPWERSRAFKDSVISGVGFVEEYLRRDRSQEAVGYGYVDWRYLWWDPYSRDFDFGDVRYFHRVKFVDLDIAIAMFPDRAAALKAIAVNTVDDDFALMDEVDGMPAMFALSGNGNFSAMRSQLGMSDQHARRRVRLIETWFPAHQVSQTVKALVVDCCDLDGLTFEEGKHKDALDKGLISLQDSVTTRMKLAIWSPGLGLCQLGDSPYKHNKLPFTASWCYRHHRDGMPYGVVRGLRDSQDEYNKRRAKALYAASVNRVFYESDAFDEDDERESLDELGRMNGEIRLAPKGMEKIKVETGLDVSRQHVDFMVQAQDHIYQGSGITKENMGQDTGALSGRAIVAKQQQGSVSTAEIFDLYRLMIELSGQKLLEVTKQGMPMERQIRIVGGNEGQEWLAVNAPRFDPVAGKVVFDNDIVNTLSDFKVAEQDFRETLRMAMAESLFETIGKLPPEMALQLIDLAVELTDIPNKAEFIARVRKLNGTTPTPPTPEDQAAAAQAQADADLAARERMAKVAKDESAAALNYSKATDTNVGAKQKSLDTAGMVAAAIPLAQAGDDIFAGANASPPQPVPPGVVIP